MKYHVEFDIDFKRNPHKGLYIALEGIDGSGKTYQTDTIANYFRKKGREVMIAREPRKEEGAFHETISQILLGKVKVTPLAMQYLFTADRIQNQEDVIIPALKEGKIVIADRSFWSILPYALSDLKMDFADDAAKFMLVGQGILSQYQQTIVPNKVLFLNISVDTAMQRLAGRSEAKEIYEKRSKIEKHYKGYHWLIDHFSDEFTILDGEGTEKEVTKLIVKEIQKSL
jgi:dTMP kinase